MHFIGIDIGTGSARAGVFDAAGSMLGTAKQDIALWREPGSIVEQSSADIWQAVVAAVRGAMAEAGVARESIRRNCDDDTYSHNVVGEWGRPQPVVTS